MTEVVLMVDLEGCITDNAPRLHHMRGGDWETYEELGPQDPVLPHFAEFLASLYWARTQLVVVTGRYEKYRAATVKQLGMADVHPDELLMRDNLDIPKTKEPELKLNMLEQVRKLYPDAIIIAMEDNDKVVEALRNAGVDCWQVRNGAVG